jgi:flagellar basal body-associated protein FliL
MKESGKKEKGMSKKTVVVLVIIAIILAGFAVANYYFDLGSKISTKFTEDSGNEKLTDSSGGKVGIVILPPEIEDKGAGTG